MPITMESGIVTAMCQADIQSGEEVVFYGHPRGGITVSDIAVDPTT